MWERGADIFAVVTHTVCVCVCLKERETSEEQPIGLFGQSHVAEQCRASVSTHPGRVSYAPYMIFESEDMRKLYKSYICLTWLAWVRTPLHKHHFFCPRDHFHNRFNHKHLSLPYTHSCHHHRQQHSSRFHPVAKLH